MENIHYNTYEQATNILLSGKHIEFTMSVPNVRDGHFAQKLEMLSKCFLNAHFHSPMNAKCPYFHIILAKDSTNPHFHS